MLLRNQNMIMISMVTPKIWVMDFLPGPVLNLLVDSVIYGRTLATLRTLGETMTLGLF